jgi:DNA-binding protein HU-beta
MNKTELIEHVADKANLTKTQMQEALRVLLETMVEKVADGDKVILVGFGSFESIALSAREGRNPKTGDKLHIPAAKVPTFTAESFSGGRQQMTDEQLEPDQLELLKKYKEELDGLELLPPATVELPAKGALALITHIQIASQHPDPTVALNPLLPSAIAAAKQIQSSFNSESAIHEVLELGWQEREVYEYEPYKIFTSLWRRRKLRRPQ